MEHEEKSLCLQRVSKECKLEAQWSGRIVCYFRALEICVPNWDFYQSGGTSNKVNELQGDERLLCCRLKTLECPQVRLEAGRPDVLDVVRTFAATRDDEHCCLGIWSAGPEALNKTVHKAAGRLSGDVRLFPLAYNL